MHYSTIPSKVYQERSGEGSDIFPELTDHDRKELIATSIQRDYQEEVCLRSEGDFCSELFLPLKGTLRVCKEGTNGKNITLYRVGRGEVCPLSLSSLLQELPFPASVLCEEGSSILRLTATAFNSWYMTSQGWQRLVARSLAEGAMKLMTTLEMVALHTLDIQILHYLLEQTDGGELLQRTHGVIAADLGLSREAVSRSLKKLEREGLISLSRREIFLIDRRRMQRVVSRGG